MPKFGQVSTPGCSAFRLLPALALIGLWLGWTRTAAATTYQVGPTRSYQNVTSLPRLNPGDRVEIDPGTYNEVKRWNAAGSAAQPIVICGVGAARPLFDATNQNVDGSMPHPRAVFQVEARFITLENLEFRNARNGNNGAGIRVTGGNNVTVRNCKITSCDMGIMSDNSSNLVIESSEVASNSTSLYDGYSHNFYLGGNSATVRFCYIHDSLYGQNFKTRAHYTELLYNYIADSQDGEIGLVDSATTGAANSHAVMIGNVVISKPRLSGYNSGRFIQFGQDSGGQHNGTLFAFNNTFLAGDRRIAFLSANAATARIVANNNIFFGSDKIAGTVGGGVAGSNNWVATTATVPSTFSSTLKGTDPGFVNRGARDFRLTTSSACQNQSLNVLTFLDGMGDAHAGLPTFEYVNHLQSHARPNDGKMDLGAYEYRAPSFGAIGFNGADCVLDFTATPGGQYELQRINNPGGSLWSPILTQIPGADTPIRVIDTNAATESQGFYRVKAL